MTLADNLHTVQAIFLFLLILVALFAAVAQRLKIPYPIVLVVAGLAISFIPHVPRIPLSPKLVFLIFLPPLLYASAWQTNWREFRSNLPAIGMLAIGLVAFTVWGVAEIADRFITALDWKSGFLLGAVVATTDAIAATSIAKSVGLPQRIVDLLEGESLVNDATGLLALEFGLTLLLRGESPSVGGGLLRLLWLIGGGLGVGLLLGAVIAWVERWVDDGPIEVVISLIVPYAAYLAGEELRASGVLAVVACGLYLSRRSVQFFSPQTRIQVGASWNALNFMLNGLIFVLIGLQLPYVLAGIGNYSRWRLLTYGAVFSAALILLRVLWMYPAAALAHWLRTRVFHDKADPYDRRGIFIVGWTGMRGVVALAAALSLPEMLGDGRPFAQRNLIIFITFSIILVTLVVQGLTLPALIRSLGLATSSSGKLSSEERDARRLILGESIAYLDNKLRTSVEAADTHSYEDLLHRYRHRLSAVGDRREDSTNSEHDSVEVFRRRQHLAREAAQVERSKLIQLRDQGAISDDVVRRLERELDLTEARLAELP